MDDFLHNLVLQWYSVRLKCLSILLFFPLYVNSQVTKDLICVDSLTISIDEDSFYLHDVFYVDSEIISRWHQWNSIEKDFDVIFAKGNEKMLFKNVDSDFGNYVSDIFQQDSGYRFFAYWTKEVFDFDTTTKIYKALKLPGNNKNYFIPFKKSNPYPNREITLRSDVGFHYPYVVYSSITYYVNLKNFKKLKASFRKKFKKENLLMLYDLEKNKVIKMFATYPTEFGKKNLNIINSHHSFVMDSSGNVFLTFGGYNNIVVYNIHNDNVSEIRAHGMNIRDNSLQLPIIKADFYGMKDLYGLLVDSYNELFRFDSKLFRTYSLSLPYDSVASLFPLLSSFSCAPITSRFEWLRKGQEKTQYIQQFNSNNQFEFELRMPSKVNCFVGYNDRKKEYYFRKKSIGFDQRLYDKTIIYTYKIP